MSTLNAYDRKENLVNLDEGKTLIVTCDSASAGVVYHLAGSSGRNPAEAFTVNAGSTVTIGPYIDPVRLLLISTVGTMTYTVEEASAVAPQIVIASTTPTDNDGRANGTIYIQV